MLDHIIVSNYLYYIGLWCLFLMIYQLSWVIQCHSNPCGKTAVILFNSLVGEGGSYLSQRCLVWFGLVWWHINHHRLFNAKSSLYIYIKYIGFGLVLWHINHCRLFNAKSFLYIYIKYIGFGLVWFGLMAYQPLWVI